MKASTVKKLTSLTNGDEILTASEGKKGITLNARTKKTSVSRYSLEPEFDEKPLYKAELIIDRFLNDR